MSSYCEVRPVTCKLLELMEDGTLSPLEVAKTALAWLSESDVKRMAEVNEFLYDEEEQHNV